MSREVTDEMIRAGARVYLHEVFYPEDIAYEEWGKASELTRKVLEAALSAAPTRARKPGYRQVTMEDARSYRAAFSAHRELHADVPVENSALAALRSVNAAIKEG